ncbi:hypothetical protein V1514DRAFT_323808 [Lipomyces japonicus]|uniref:uncharacterized protein n=1 Tax=Lipomyces japonicus TaxID=56871 RepID=UPI0034D02036
MGSRGIARHPYQDNVPLDDTNDTIFLGDSDEDGNDDFFFSSVGSGSLSKHGKEKKNLQNIEPIGEYRTLPDSGEQIYVAKPPRWEVPVDNGSNSERSQIDDIQGFSLLLFLTNGLGIESLNNRLLADEFAREGYFVVAPDLFSNDPNSAQSKDNRANDSDGGTALLSKFKNLAINSVSGFMTDMWIARHTEEKTWPVLVHMVEEIVELYRPRDICIVGYSFGAKYGLKLLQLPLDQSLVPQAEPKKVTPRSSLAPSFSIDLHNPSWARLIFTGVMCHPSLAEKKDFSAIKKPVLIIGVEDDPLFPPDLLKTASEKMTKDNIFFDIKLYDRKLPHGFAVKGDYPPDNLLVNEGQLAAHNDVLGWLKSFIA